MIDHDVVRLNISVHNAFAMAEIQRLQTVSTPPRSRSPVAHLQELENIESNIVVDKFGVEASKVGIVDVFEDKGGRLALHQK